MVVPAHIAYTNCYTHADQRLNLALWLCSKLLQSQACGVFYSSLGAKYTDAEIKGGKVSLQKKKKISLP